MPSFSKECDQYKKIYDACFSDFFPKFLSGDKNDPCGDKLAVYVNCVRKDLEKLNLDIKELDQSKLLGGDRYDNMMINQLITYLLDKVIGKYVENFSTQNVKTGIFKGDIRLENLPLKSTVLEDLFEWPILVKSGFIGRVTLRIPYTRFRSQAWAIMIEDIYIIAGPNSNWKLFEKEFQNENMMKKLLLDSIEVKWRKKIRQQGDNEKVEGKIWLSYVASLGYRIMRNLQIEVRNVHVRYEDNSTIPSQIFATGLLVEAFSTKSSDFDWESKTELTTDLDVLNKQVDLSGISIYLDTKCKVISDVSAENIKSVLQEKINEMPKSDYIVNPISLHGIMKRNINPLPMNHQPRISLHLQMEQVDVSLSQRQYKIAVALSDEFERFDRQKHHMKYRPRVSVMESPKEWWVFAITEHTRHIFKGPALRERARNLVKYVQSYEDYLLNKDSNFEAEFRNSLESDLELDCLLQLREKAMERVGRKNRDLLQNAVHSPAPQQSGWWGYLWGSRSKEISPEILDQSQLTSETSQILEKLLPQDSNTTEQGLEQDITEILNEVDFEAVNFFTRDRIFLRGEFSLDGIKLKLLKDTEIPILEINAENLIVGFESRPQYSSWCIRIGLRSLFVKDLNPDYNDNFFRDVVSSREHSQGTGGEIFALAFEVNPLPSTCPPNIKRILAISSEPLTIVHCPLLIANIQEYFSRSTENIKAAAEKHIRNAKARTSESIKKILDKGSSDIRWWVSLKISAPKIILPNYRLIKTHEPSCVLLDLGRLQVSNCNDQMIDRSIKVSALEPISYESDLESEDFVTPCSSPFGSLENISMEANCQATRETKAVTNIYDEYSIKLENVMALVGNWDELKSELSKNTSKNPKLLLMEPFNFILDLKKKCVMEKSCQSPNIIMESNISRLLISISDQKLQLTKDCLESVTSFINNYRSADTSSIKHKKQTRMENLNTSSEINENYKSVSINFVLHSFIIQLESGSRPLAELSLTKTQFQLSRYSSMTIISAHLLNLILADARANLGSKLDFILASHKCLHNDQPLSESVGEPIIEFTYKISQKSGSSDLREINLIFADLDVIANQETLIELLSFMRPLFSNDSLQIFDKKPETPNTKKIKPLDVSIACKAVSILLIKISSNFDSENRFAVSVGRISLSQMNLLIHKNGTAINSTLRIRSINVEDISILDSFHKNILTLTTGSNETNMEISENEDVINISVIQENTDSPFFVSGTMPHIIYVHSPEFLHSVGQCISEFQIYFYRLKHNIAAVARTAILSSEESAKIGFLNSVKLNLRMLSPILALPRHKTSNQIILVNLGDIEIISDTQSLQVTFSDAIVISKELPIQNGGYDISICTDNNSKFPLVNKIDLVLKFSKLYNPSKILIECEFSSSLSLSFSKAVYEQVLKSMDNLVYDDEDEIPAQFVEFEDENMQEDQNPDISQNEIPIVLRSNISQIKMELYPDSFDSSEDPMLRLLLQGITLEFVRANKYIKDIELAVDQISLYQVLDSRQKRIEKLLIYSFSSSNIGQENLQEKSASCPDLLEQPDASYSNLTSTSIPNPSSFYKYAKRKKSLSNSIETQYCAAYELKQPKNTVKSTEPNKLASIKIRLIDKKFHGFSTECDSISRFVDADFNQLTFRISMEAWVILLDFFGFGSRFYDPKDVKDLLDVSKVLPSFNRRYDGEIEEIINTKLNIHMKRFSLILENETHYINHSNLAGISTIDFDLQAYTKDGNMTLSGSLSDFQLVDLSPTGSIYNQRLFPASNQDRILEFTLFKYGLPDPSQLREEDMRLSTKISAPIVYIHTQRFLQELNQFFQNFLQYQDRLSHIRVTSAGRIVDKSAQRSARIRMKVFCQAPLLLLPVSAFSDHILVVDLGKLSLVNEFKFSNNDFSQCLLDEMKIDLHEMDVYSAIRITDSILHDNDLKFPCLNIRPIYPKPLSEKCNLNLTVSRNLNSNISHSSPDWQIYGILSSVIFSIGIEQYRTIRGVLAHNLGENTDHLKSYKFQAFQTDPILHTDLTGIAYPAMKIELCLNDVQLNLMSKLQGIDNYENINLCRLNFYQSKLFYESFSDSSKTTELVCQQITVEDMRYASFPANKRLNVFPIIISPDKNTSKLEDDIDNCQLRIKYSSDNDQNSFIVQLNKMKAIMIFDWVQITKNWIFTAPYGIVSLATDDENRFDQHVAFYIQSKPQSRSISFQPVIMRKHYQEIIQEEFKPTELTLNVQESRFFILENSSQLHTHALILIVAGTCSYKTRENRPGPFSFSVSQFHLASCVMSSDSSNLLSIINPVKIVIKSEEKICVIHGKPSLDDVLHDKDSTKLGVDIAVSAFKIRLSFSDIQLLGKIIRSFQNQTVPPANLAFQTGYLRHRWSSLNFDNLNIAKSSQSNLTALQKLSKFVDRISIHHLEDHEFVSVCLIDDCIDADVPLFDIKFNNVTVDIELGNSKGLVKAFLSVDYYNTNSFGWTPVIEPWPLTICWFWLTTKKLSLTSEVTLNADISSHLLQIAKNTHKKWSTEFQEKKAAFCDCRIRHNNLFVPFLIVNELGCPIEYRKLSLENPPMYNEIWKTNKCGDENKWILVPDSTPASLFFDMETTARDKIRYDKLGSHFNTSHRIELKIEGWSKCQPVTVDKLGIFYRHLQSDTDGGLDLVSTYIRIVIEIVRQGSVQNKIIIRSPLQLCNSLNIPLEVKFSEKSTSFTTNIVLKPNTVIPIPLLYQTHDIRIRPLSPSHDKPVSPSAIDCLFYSPIELSENIFSWCTVNAPGQKIETEVFCVTSKSNFNAGQEKNKIYLICTIERLNFPLAPKMVPGHLITISAPFSLENRLPCDVRFAMKSHIAHNGSAITNEALVRPSGQCTVLTTSMKQSTYFSVYLDSFPRCDPLLIHGEVKLSHSVLIRLYDDQNRLLELEVKVESRPSGPVSVVISALYWIVNRTSLPLVYAQSGETESLAAGHVPENEEACSSMPFPFNFSNKNDSFTFRVRLGSKAQLSNMENFKPLWSEKVSLEKVGTTTLQLRAASIHLNRPHLLYNIGLEIRPGRGKHVKTKMIILTARYLLDNRSSYPLYFIQYNCNDDQNKPIMALPASFLTFHWPRDDLDQLLTVQKLDSNHQSISKVSGGFQIDVCNSFHVYLRGINNNPPSQLRVTITLQGARYRVVFTDADDLPSPYKLENLTNLQVFFYQDVSESSCRKHSVLPPKSCIPYALDEPTLPPNINLCIEGGTQSCYDINKVGPGPNLYYDNFLYIAICNSYESDLDNLLVFDVAPNGKKVFLNQKSSVSRSQLWYYSSKFELFHEGSIAPHDPKQKLDRSADNHLLLDVDILAPCPSSSQKQMYRMILAKADPRRVKYQRWFFSEGGVLANKLGMKCYINASCKNAAVFGGFETLNEFYAPLVCKNWFRPGSGEVLVSVVTDGPTRVMQLIDKEDESILSQSQLDFNADSSKFLNIEIHFSVEGFGVFLINHIPEELLYAVCNNVDVVWRRQSNKDNLLVIIGKIQIDNQQMDAGYPCVMYEENKSESPSSNRNAFSLKLQRELGHPYDVHVFSFIRMHMAPMCIILEEKMLLKTMQMFLSPSKEAELLEEDFSSLQHQSHFDEGRKIYIGNLKLLTGVISLSVITAESLPSDLKQMKKLFPSLMSFTNAQIIIDVYDRNHVFETGNLIAQSIAYHYRNQLRSQAMKIFGSVDFLGNPIGFISDITTGMKRLYSDQDVYNMVKHFAHGIGDSTAKICSSASRVISEITMDPEYEEKRQRLFENARISGSNTAQVKAGFKSLAYGIWGGIKSVPTQLDKGYKDEGPSGLFIGALKGIVGVVTKPVGGMLDLATGSATSFREIARSSKEGQPPRRYEPRCLSSSWKLLPYQTSYSNNLRRTPLSDLTQAQHLLARFSASSSSVETVVGFLIIQNSMESQLKVIVSDASIHIIKTVSGESDLLKHYPLSRLSIPPISVHSKSFIQSSPYCKNSVYVNFNYLRDMTEHQVTPKPPFKCDTVLVAKQLVKLVCEAHCDYLERQMTYSAGL